MRKTILTLALLGSALAGSLAYAGAIHSTSAEITAINVQTETVTLADGHSYAFTYGTDLSKFHVGDSVAVQWVPAGNDRVGSTIVES
jgi:Protein of unknown function (DUF1344)